MQKAKGITLVSLIITIIVMLILAGVSISVLFDPKGIIERGKVAVEEANISNYSEALGNIGIVLMPEKVEKKLSGKSYMDRYEEEIRKEAEGGSIDGSTVTRQNDETVRVVTEEGYVFDVTEREVKYIGKQGETPAPPAIIETDLEFKTNPEGPTNKDVVVTIVPKVTIDENYTIQYVQKNLNEEPKETDWKNYALGTEIKFTQKGNVFVRLINKLSETGQSFTHTVNNIDKQDPNTFKATAEQVAGNKSNSIVVKGHTTDKAETTEYASSGIKEYYFKKVGANDDDETIKANTGWEGPEKPNGNNDVSHTFTGLTQGGTYYFVMKAVDNAGNETITEKAQASTEAVPGLETADITFNAQPTTPTKGNVTVTISLSKTYEGYTLQYAKKDKNQMPGDGDWEDYKIGTTKITLDHNGNVFARLRDENNQGGKAITTATATVNNIDKEEPNTFKATAEPVSGNKSNSIVVKGHTTDKPETTEYASSGIKEYYFKKVGANDDDETIKANTGWEGPEKANGDNDVSHTFGSLTQGQTYYFVMKAVDNAGNETITAKVSAGTESVPGLTTGDITFKASSETWTKDSVTVTINLTKTFPGYELQYAQKDKDQTPGDGDWADYEIGKTTITLERNGNVFARLIDSKKQPGTMASQDISNIDSAPPTGDNSGITTTVTDTQITANLNVTDTGGSGLAKVEWKYSAKNGGMGTLVETNKWSELHTDVSKPGATSKTASTTIKNLVGNTEYDIKAIIYDVAGNTKEVTKLAVKTNPTRVSSITLEPASLSIKEKETGTIKATVLPANATYKTVTWSSESDQIATVTDNKDGTATVTGVKAGTTNIVATADGVTQKCSVEVKLSLHNVTITKDNYRDYLGKVVTNFRPEGVEATENVINSYGTYTVGTKYRLYYVDFGDEDHPNGKYGDGVGTIYLKADCTDKIYSVPKTDGTAVNSTKMKQLNPKLYEITPPSTENMQQVKWLLNPANWKSIKTSSPMYINDNNSVNYVVGAPSLELMIDSYNTYYNLTGSSPQVGTIPAGERRKLFYQYQVGYYGYKVGPAVGAEYGNRTLTNSIFTDDNVNEMYYPGAGHRYWLGSPSANNINNLFYVSSDTGGCFVGYSDYTQAFSLLVSLKSSVQLEFAE